MTTKTRIFGMSLVLLLAVACGGGGDTTGDASPKPTSTGTATKSPAETPTGGDRVELEVEAEDFSFDASSYTVPADGAIELKFKNRDPDIPHTFTVYQDDSAQQEIFGTGNLIGDRERTYEFTAPSEPGTYYFQCDVHPEMNGDLVVE